MGISVSGLVVKYGEFVAVKGIDVSVKSGEHLTLLGPSGCGKTTTLRSIAGLERPSGGEIRMDDRTLYSSLTGEYVPAERRNLSMVFQSYAIWPHMTVFDNVAYGLRVRRKGAAETRDAVSRALAMMHMEAYANRLASQLSGGQQQRVALARAIAYSPAVILFDEPLSNLDAKLRIEMRQTLLELRRKVEYTAIYVTHDQEEALAISDRLVVMNGGRIVQIGTPSEVYDRPNSAFVADFVGTANLISGTTLGDAATMTFRGSGGTLFHVCAPYGRTGSETQVAIRAPHIDIVRADGDVGDQPNTLMGTIDNSILLGDFREYKVRTKEGLLTVRTLSRGEIEQGAGVRLNVDAERCVLLRPSPAEVKEATS